MFLLDILIENGFELIKGKHLDYSTMRTDGIDSRYKKGDILFIWGLHELGKPPTLIYPRPTIISKTENSGIEIFDDYSYLDDVMNECLNTFSHEDIYQGILNNWIFNLHSKEIIK